MPFEQELDDKARAALGNKGGGLPPTTILDRLRKRLRMNGYRTHLTLQVCHAAAAACIPLPVEAGSTVWRSSLCLMCSIQGAMLALCASRHGMLHAILLAFGQSILYR